MASVSIRFDDKIKEDLDKAAKDAKRSINSFVTIAVQQKIERDFKYIHGFTIADLGWYEMPNGLVSTDIELNNGYKARIRQFMDCEFGVNIPISRLFVFINDDKALLSKDFGKTQSVLDFLNKGEFYAEL